MSVYSNMTWYHTIVELSMIKIQCRWNGHLGPGWEESHSETLDSLESQVNGIQDAFQGCQHCSALLCTFKACTKLTYVCHCIMR